MRRTVFWHHPVHLPGMVFGNSRPLGFIAGPCVIEEAAFTVREQYDA